MTLLETLLSDALLALLRSPYARWGAAFGVSLFVWVTGAKDARFRGTYIALPFIAAAAIEILDSRFFGTQDAKSGWFPLYLWSGEAFRKLASWVGLGTMLLAIFLGRMRGLGFLLTLSAFTAAYIGEPMLAPGVGMFSLSLLTTLAALLPAVLMVHLSFYGLGALFRRRGPRRTREDE